LSDFEAGRQGAFDYMAMPYYLRELERVVDRCTSHQARLTVHRCFPEQSADWVIGQATQLNEASWQPNYLFDLLTLNYPATLQALTAALELHDTASKGHGARVVAYALRLGKSLHLSSQEMLALEQGALLHDLGKICVASHILNKPGPLTNNEWVEMRRHVEYGAELLRSLEFIPAAVQVVLQHHEKWDGTGYPYGLKGEAITLNARICAVADTVDAITSQRPYRAANSFEAAAAEIKQWAGKQFDPCVVEAFLSVAIDEWKELQTSLRSQGDSLQS
jgi:putative nucleotidyltransferase with HDIG domain